MGGGAAERKNTMDILKSIGDAFGSAMSFVGEKNRKAAYLNRIRTVIRCEEKAAEKEYIALGRYYYNNLRDRNNPVTESHCAELDVISERLESALAQLEAFYQAEHDAACVAIIGGEDGPTAVCVKGEAEEIDLEDVEAYDHDPMGSDPAEAPAEADENADLPFEG